MRRAGEPSLLELAGHRQEPLDERGQILARDGASPGVGARAAVGEDAARGDEAFLARRPQLRDRLEPWVVEDPIRQVELGLDVGLLGAGAKVRRVPGRAEEEADRLSEDRLPRAGLAGDGVQARSEREVRLADEDEALDAQAPEQRAS